MRKDFPGLIDLQGPIPVISQWFDVNEYFT
jgi:hypothetical protein